VAGATEYGSLETDVLPSRT